MKNAQVVIEFESLKGDVLTATCTAVFEMETDVNAPKEGQTLLVAFPLTMHDDKVVKVTDFELSIDGVRKSGMKSHDYLLSSEPVDPSTLFWGGPPVSIKMLVVDPRLGELFGYRIRDDFSATDPVLSRAYAWEQTFVPGVNSLVQVKYQMTLYAQSLAYTKTMLKGESRNIVPFDLMWAGASDEKAFLLDYILRSGATWKGPIGHETVLLRATKNSGIGFEPDAVVTMGRHRFAGRRADYSENLMLQRAGVSAPGIIEKDDTITWEIKEEDPQQDIIVQIPMSALRNGVKR